jgi:HlyD family secretion protein
MTANVTIEVARRDAVLRVPAAALRFKPDAKLLASLGATAPAGKGSVVWVSNGNTLSATAVKAGATDGSFTELVDPALPEGTRIVTRATVASSTTPSPAPAATNNPLMPSRPGAPRR